MIQDVRNKLLIPAVLPVLLLAGQSFGAISQVAGGFLFTGTNSSILVSDTNGSIISVSSDQGVVATGGDAGLWAVDWTNNVSNTEGTIYASSFSDVSASNTFSWTLDPASNVLWLTYSNTDVKVVVTVSNRTDGVDMSAELTSSTNTLVELRLPAQLRFATESVERFVAPNHSSDGVGLALTRKFFEVQDENSPATWREEVEGPGPYIDLFGGALDFLGDNSDKEITFTTNGVAWLGAAVSNAWEDATAIVNRPPAAGQYDVVLIDSTNGPYFSGSKLGGSGGYLMRLSGQVNASRVQFSLDIITAAIEHLAQVTSNRTRVAMLSMVRGPVIGESWPSEVRLDQWLSRLNSSDVLATNGYEVVELTNIPEMFAAMADTNYLAILNPYGELTPADLSQGIYATVSNIGSYVTSGGNWFETGGHPFFFTLEPELYYTNSTFYPPLFADFQQLETTNGNAALYGVQPASHEPWAGATNTSTIFVPGRLVWGGDANGGYFRRAFATYVPNGETWTSPRARITLGRTAVEALNEYGTVNDFYRGLTNKMDSTTLNAFKQGIMIHYKGGATQMIARIDDLPAPALLHFEEYLYGGFDKEYPDHLPPNAEFGTSADFTNFLGEAKARGHLTMPYTNPTFWGVDPKGPTFLATNDAPLLINPDGTFNLEVYFGESGLTVTPWQDGVQKANRATRNGFITNFPVDFIFHDQLGARTWQFDLNPASPTPAAYLDGLINIAAEDSQFKALSTENGYDRLINHESQFAGLAWGLAPTTNAPFWRRYLRDRYATDTWNIFPLAQQLAHDKVSFTYNNLDASVHNHEVMAWTLGLGYGTTYVITPDQLDEIPRRQWLLWIDRVQKSVIARYVGRPVNSFSHQWRTNALPFDNGVIAATYGPVDIVGNLGPVELTTNGWTLAPNGYLATAPGLTAGRIMPPDGAAAVSYVAETNSSGGLDFWIYSVGDTNLTIVLPSGFNGDVTLEVDGDSAVETQVVANAISVPLGAAATSDAYLWHGTIAPAGVTTTVFVDFGRHDGLSNPPTTNGFPTVSPDINGNHWNNIGPTTQSVPMGTEATNLVDTANNETGIDLEMITTGWEANGILNGGLLTPSPALLGELAITNATHDYFFTTVSSTFRLSGLDTNSTYDLTFFGTREWSTERITKYASGTNEVTLQTSGTGIGYGGYNGNNDTTVTLSNLLPNASGDIDVTLSVVSGGFAYLGIMKIETTALPPSTNGGGFVSATQNVVRIDLGRHDGGSNGDATTNPDTNGNYWNNLGPTSQAVPLGTKISNMITVSNAVTGFSLETTSAGWSANGLLNGGLFQPYGPSPAELGDLAIESATEDYFFTSGTDSLKLAGLNPLYRYNLSFFGSRSNATERTTEFAVGTNTVTLITSGPDSSVTAAGTNRNDHAVAALTGIAPDPFGEIDIDVTRLSGSFAHLNLMQIEEVTQPAPTGGAASLYIDPASLTFSGKEDGPTPPTQTFGIANTGSASLTYSLATNVNWLSLSPASGTLSAGAYEHITVTVSMDGLVEGTSNGTITVTSGEATNSPLQISVTLNVTTSVPTFMIFGSSVAKGWSSSGFTSGVLTNGSWTNGYAYYITKTLTENDGLYVTNTALPGENTSSAIARFPSAVAPEQPDYLLIAYSLGNEGLAGTIDPTAGSITTNFIDRLYQLVGLCRSNGFYPIISSVYPHGSYNAVNYAYVKQTHLEINSWNVPSLNLLGTIDDGAGQWIDGFWADGAHPNDAGYYEFYSSFVPSLVAAIESGKTNSPQFGSTTNFARLTLDGAVNDPITFTPSNTVHSFTTAFRVRTTDTGTIATVKSGANYATLEIRATQLVYVTTTGAEIDTGIDVNEGEWHDVALASRFALSNSWVFVDGVEVASHTENFVPDQFILGGPSASGRAATPGSVDLQSWCVYRSAWSEDEATAQAAGDLQQSSMEIGAMLDDPSFVNGSAVINAAQSLSEAIVNTANVSAESEEGAPTILIFGSSVAKGWNAGGGITNGGYTLGYAGRLNTVLDETGWVFTNASIGGNDTSDALARFDSDAVSVQPDVILIGLSMGNEGLLSDPDGAFASFTSGMTNLIHRSRTNGFYPVIGLNYPNGLYDLTDYDYVKRMNLMLNTWDVPSINLLGATDDGVGQWALGYEADSAHPNTEGHAEMFYAVVPSLFDAIEAGKTNTPELANTIGYARINGAASEPLTFTPDRTMHGFNMAFRVRTLGTGTVAAVVTATNAGGTIEVRDDAIVYVSPDDQEISAPVDGNDGGWYDVALSYSYVRTQAMLYVDGVLAGSVTDSPVPEQFVLGGSGTVTGRPAAPAELDLQDWCVYRAPWTPDEAMAQHREAFQQASLEIGAPLFEGTFTQGGSVSNLAQSLSEASVNEINVTAGATVVPPGLLTAASPDYNTVVLSWFDNSGTESGFVIDRRPLNTGAYWSNIIVLAANSTGYTNTGVAEGDYEYRVSSLEGMLQSDYSAADTVTVTNMPIVDDTVSYRDWAWQYFPLPADTYWIDFNNTASPDYGGQIWNTVTSLTEATPYSLVNTNGGDYGYRLSVVDAFDQARTDNGNPLAEYDDDAQKVSFHVGAGGSAGVVLSNLTKDATYDALVFARRGNIISNYDYTARFQFLSALDTVDFEIYAGGNTQPVRVFGLRADDARSLRMNLLPPTSPTGLIFATVNFLAVTEISGPGPYLIDFNTLASPSYPAGETWNTVTSLTAATAYALADVDGDASAGYTLILTDGFDQFRSANGDLPGGFDGDAETTCFALRDDVPLTASMTFGGLDTNLLYDFVLLANRGVVVGGFDYSGTYTFTGAVTTVVVVDGATNTTYTDVTGLAPDSAGNIRLTVSAGTGTNTPFPVINLIRLSQNGASSGPALLYGPNEDADGNGLDNAGEYGLNGDPTDGSANDFVIDMIETVATGTTFTAYYERYKHASQAAYDVEYATNLISQTWMTGGASETVLDDDGTNLLIRIEKPVTAPSANLRIGVRFQP